MCPMPHRRPAPPANHGSVKRGCIIRLFVVNSLSIHSTVELTNHNLRVSGPDKEYDTSDDFEPQPFVIKPGETGRTVVKIEPPDTYPFRCDFHPLIQIGTLLLQ